MCLPVKNVKQAYSNWCWAAGCESILYYCRNYLGFGQEATQWDIVKYIYGSYVNQPASLYDVQRALRYFGVGSSRMYPISGYTISYGQICEQIINLKSPIGGHFFVGTGHFAVICGAYQYFDSRGFLINELFVMDPWVGYVVSKKYNDLIDNNYDWDLLDAIRVYRP
ncbi:papain like cysteine protease AvrRpt2 [Caldicellulosiruptor bescii]|uniref:Peptidase C39-like domain-containing protein n=1 Tax=Caldicellulosiruptor bescii (strain ATCC BAA-1888 / DSM 6725 / KCTC 15123 / Z-1320) TaxID=521460 RepID=B9MRH7_CALBD|nr:papain-like cysteine protease family protein [Caldicellulosiruptor bescii]ACM60281.1 conserved hypothetical protein [Caldicellulosiruptor bescii DSM 6725]PBC87696.1 papain like cysteine protease AvrRpt2 [Caldicellulosiruptor bescii]PBC90629.1 papain like cysteine protease AvrRpt2 [Caldicellulosiruptor bescii]PBD06426.1 papain like cysteine protease AvrRpt2 [Caldicellulosiruptor bescii]PBD08568.1 papain like cysteine protease AvrRpt2 [Caldicellulosiruptor bescii]